MGGPFFHVSHRLCAYKFTEAGRVAAAFMYLACKKRSGAACDCRVFRDQNI